jgi:hypothetical protein
VLLAKKGFKSYVNRIDNTVVETYFAKETFTAKPEIQHKHRDNYDWDFLLQKFENNLVYVDVRHLNMPLPMTTILEALETLPEYKALHVHHKRIPVFLLTELQDREFDYHLKEMSENEVFLLIFKRIL